MHVRSVLKRVPGFRSGKRWKVAVASVVYLFLFLVILAVIVPISPTLALDELKPTNRNSASISGKTSPDKPVYLLQNENVFQSTKADSGGKFAFALNKLEDGTYTYMVEACDTDKRERCSRQTAVLIVDFRPPSKPTLTAPKELPDSNEQEVSIKGEAEPNSKIVSNVGGKELVPITVTESGSYEIKTKLNRGTNDIQVKAVDSVGNESEAVSSKIVFNPKKYKVKVLHVTDGDTIKVEGDKVIRYIGIDTPETVHPSKPVQCYGKEASAKNRELVEGKEVLLEKDVSELDKYGRQLRYVWLGDTLVSEYLVREGYAQSSSYPSDVKYQDRFVEAQRLARQENKGLWGDVCNPSTTPVPPAKQSLPMSSTPSNVGGVTPTEQPTTTQMPAVQPTESQQTVTEQPPAQGGSGASYTCNCSKTCSQMSSCEEAQYQLNVCGCKARDADKDGIACDSDCQ